MSSLRVVGSLLVLLATASVAGAQTPSANLDDYALFSVLELKSRGLVVTDGDIGVNSPGGQFYVAFSLHAPESDVAAGKVRLPSPAECKTLFTNAATLRRCGISRRFVSPFASPAAVSTACGFPTTFPRCGGPSLTIEPAHAFRLMPGTYNNIVVRGGISPGRLILLGGNYTFCSLKTGRNADILFDSASSVFIDGDMNIAGTNFGGTGGEDIGAQDIRFFVRGTSVKIRPHARVFGRLCAPNAKLRVRWGAKLFGSFIAQKIRTDHITVRGLPAGTSGTTTTTTTTATTTTTRPPGSTTTTLTTTTTKPASTSTTTTVTTTTTLPHTGSCGNAFLDPGEACDPPGSAVCPTPGGGLAACSPSCDCPQPLDLRCCVPPSPAGGFVDCELLKPAECAAQGGVIFGVGSCDPSPCAGISIPSTTRPPVTTTTTTRPATATTTTTSPRPSTTTTTAAHSTTTTTIKPAVIPPPAEICGNCIDDDGNGATDFEDSACCEGTQRFEMALKNGRIRPRGATSAVKLNSSLAAANPSGIDPKRQDVFVQIRADNGELVLCAQVPSGRFMSKHGAFRFWDRQRQVTSAKGITDMTVKIRRNGKITFGTHGKQVQLAGATQGMYRITVGFRDGAQVASSNRCAVVQKRFRAGSTGALVAR